MVRSEFPTFSDARCSSSCARAAHVVRLIRSGLCCNLTNRSSRCRFAPRLNSGVRPHDGSSQLPKEVSPNGKFDLLRFTIVMAVASIAFGLGKNAAESSRVLFAIGMFFLAIFHISSTLEPRLMVLFSATEPREGNSSHRCGV